MRIRTTIAGLAAGALLLAGCAGNDGEDVPESPGDTQEEPDDAADADDGNDTSDDGDDGSDGDAGGDDGEDGDGADGSVALGGWVEVEPAHYFITAAPGLALLSTGEQDMGEEITRDVAAYNETGAVVWEHPNVREMHNLPEAVSAGENLALIDTNEANTNEANTNDQVPMLRGLTWTDGSELWATAVDELLQCTEDASVSASTDSAVLVDALGDPCAGTEPRPVAASLDGATGEVLGQIEGSGAVTATFSADDSESWYLQVDGDGAQVHRLVLDSGEAEQDVVTFDEQASDALTGDDVEYHTMWPASGHEVVLMAWAGEDEVSIVLADLDSGEGRLVDEAAACAQPGGIYDPASSTCVVDDGEMTTAYDFEGNELWSVEGSTGLTFDGDSQVEPVEVAGERAWLISAEDDLIQALQVDTGEPLWTAGEGEGSGMPSAHHPPGAEELVVGIQNGAPATQVLRLEAATGEELERSDLTDAWVLGDDHLVAVHADEATLLAFTGD